MLKEGYTLPYQTEFVKVTDTHQLLCISPQVCLPVGGIASADQQKCSRIGQKSRISGFLQPAIFGPKTKQQREMYTRSEQSQQIPQFRQIKMEIPETIWTSLQTGEWVKISRTLTSIYPYKTNQKIFHVQDKIY